jgi:NADH:ubiquinone oxidoreductase subunit 2 (subunit N)
VLMYMKEPNPADDALPAAGPALTVAIVGSAIATLALGIFPSFVLDFASKSGLK